jgi:glycogen phosphorylase
VQIPVYGSIAHSTEGGAYAPKWVDFKIIVGVPHDMPIVGYGGRTVNVLRLFSARASDEFDIGIFNSGDYIRAVQDKITGESISKVLYPSDIIAAGRELRLLQEYFLVACSVRDILKRYRETHESCRELSSKVAIQLNDTHPALTIAELMRVLVDEERIAWEEAWATTVATCGYTNHTLLPEALEKWPYELIARVLPRHLQIIQEINRRLLAEVERRFPGDLGMQRVSIIADGNVHMANLAMAGSHSVNGVAALHSKLVTTTLAPEFYRLWPERFNNKTNGVTPRRWLMSANRSLASLITKTIGDQWITDLDRLRELELFADDPGLLERLDVVKRRNKVALARLTKELTGVTIDPLSMFDVQVKRIHEYKRQLLNALHVVHRYWELVENRVKPIAPRTVIFAGKAAPGYWMAKLIIKLIHSIAEVVNAEPRSRDWLRVVFLPDYRVTLAEAIMPAAELSEQISTAGKEASGTGNMKLALNGALTIGTLDGANIEIRDEVGEENIFIFGLETHEVASLMTEGYDPQRWLGEHRWMRRAVDSISSGHFSRGDKDIFRPIVAKLLSTRDEYVHLADLPAYVERQRDADAAYVDRNAWLHKSLLNIARVGKFSSDRTISEYARDIWGIKPAVIGNFAHALE